jgi:hypothetical protein
MSEVETHGGKREGAGRPKGSLNKRSLEIIQEVAERYPDWSPLMHLATVANDEAMAPEVRLDAAKAAAPYVHAKIKPVVADADELVDLEARIARARLEAQAEVLEEKPGLADRLARAVGRHADDIAILAATRPVVLDMKASTGNAEPVPSATQAKPAQELQPDEESSPAARPEPPSPPSDWQAPAQPSAYVSPIWPEPRQNMTECEYEIMPGSLLSARRND